MPRYVNINALTEAQANFVRALAPPLPRNQVLVKPSPHQFYMTLPKSEIPPNVRIQENMTRDRQAWQGISTIERIGGKNHKDTGKEWRVGQGREGRTKGGLLWALRER